jgi:hypothetical protein
MNSNLPPTIPSTDTPWPHAAGPSGSRRSVRALGSWFLRGARLVWQTFLGMVFCQAALTSICVLGWLQRAMQRWALSSWWKLSPLAGDGVTFDEWVRGSYRTVGHGTSPRWIWGQPDRLETNVGGESGGWNRIRRGMRRLGGSLWRNSVLGLQALGTTGLLTVPAGVLWLFAWYDGWNNSFNKGYEQAAVGPLTFVLGILVFIAAMIYVPMAQARQAVTGQWRCFFDFRLVWTIQRERWVAILGLAALYALLAVPANGLKTLPGFFPQMNATLAAMGPEEAQVFLRRYFLLSAAYFFPALVFLRWVAARIYASGLVSAVRRGAIAEESLSEFEWESLHRLGLLGPAAPPTRPRWVQAAAWFGTRMGRATALGILGFIWFLFAAQILVAEFLNGHPVIGWLNQPLIQLPWFRYLPPMP